MLEQYTSVDELFCRLNSHVFPDDVQNEVGARIGVGKNKYGLSAVVLRCLVRDREVEATPNEYLRQLLISKLFHHYGYPLSRMRLDFQRPNEKRNINISPAPLVVMHPDRPDEVYLVGYAGGVRHQSGESGGWSLRKRCRQLGATYGIWTEGEATYCCVHRGDGVFDEIGDIPNARGVLNLPVPGPHLLDLLLPSPLKPRMLSNLVWYVWAALGGPLKVGPECAEILKVLFAKLYDERLTLEGMDDVLARTRRHPDRLLTELRDSPQPDDLPLLASMRRARFRATGDPEQTAGAVQELFAGACRAWPGLYAETERIEFSPAIVHSVVSHLQAERLARTDPDEIEQALDCLLTSGHRASPVLNFTPPYLREFLLRMLDPQPHEALLDTSPEHGGFARQAVYRAWTQPNESSRVAGESGSYAHERVFSMVAHPEAYRRTRLLEAFVGQSLPNVLPLDVLDREHWAEVTGRADWQAEHGEAFARLQAFRTGPPDDHGRYAFDVLLCRPTLLDVGPVAWADDRRVLTSHLDLLRPGGRLAMVLRHNRFDHPDYQEFRDFLVTQARILAVVGLDDYTFRPGHIRKCSVLFLQKWNDDPAAGPLCPHAADYPVFFAQQKREGTNVQGDRQYWRRIIDLFPPIPPEAMHPDQDDPDEEEEDEEAPLTPLGEDPTTEPVMAVTDRSGLPVVWHDLYATPTTHRNFERTPDGIAEAFAAFARRERLSFAPKTH